MKKKIVHGVLLWQASVMSLSNQEEITNSYDVHLLHTESTKIAKKSSNHRRHKNT